MINQAIKQSTEPPAKIYPSTNIWIERKTISPKYKDASMFVLLLLHTLLTDLYIIIPNGINPKIPVIDNTASHELPGSIVPVEGI